MYRQPIIDLFLSCPDWPVIRKCLDASARRSLNKYRNVKGQPQSQVYAFQRAEYDNLAAMLCDRNSRWARKYRQQRQPTKPLYRQLELWQFDD